MRDIRAITLDLDDTLWPIGPVIERAEQRLHEWLQANCPRTAQAYPVHAMRALRERVANDNPHLAHDYCAQRTLCLEQALLPGGYGQEHVDAAYAAFFAARNEVQFFDDALPALRRLAARYPLVSLSNGNADLGRIGLSRYFRHAVSARECGVGKPAAAIFHAACAKLGLEPSQVLHVGDDAQLDVAGAKAAGMSTAWINRGTQPWLASDVADLQVRDLLELADHLETAAGATAIKALA